MKFQERSRVLRCESLVAAIGGDGMVLSHCELSTRTLSPRFLASSAVVTVGGSRPEGPAPEPGVAGTNNTDGPLITAGRDSQGRFR